MVVAPEVRNPPQRAMFDYDEFGTLLATNPEALLAFYVEHSKGSLDKLRGGLVNLMQDPVNNLPALKRQTDEVAFDLVSLSPGTDHLPNPELEILFHHSSFVSLWMNLAYLAANDDSLCSQAVDGGSALNIFIYKLFSGVTPEFRRLRLDPVEFGALKAISMWKISSFGSNETARVLSGEQYLGVAKALNDYHQTKPLQDFEKAGRLADITSLLAPITAAYGCMMEMYTELNIDDTYRGDFV